jgi:c(7)-type cytochrome triheme protein
MRHHISSGEKRIVRIILSVLLYGSLSEPAHAVENGVTITYGGKGAGEIVFSGTSHAKAGLGCSDCHESHGFSFAIFEMKKGADMINMRRIEMGESCGHCHPVTITDTSSCSKCHRK